MINYPSRQDGAILPACDQALSHKENFSCYGVLSHIINPLFTKLVRSRWLDIGLPLFCVFMDHYFVLIQKHAKKELGQYPAILTEQAWSITHISKPHTLDLKSCICTQSCTRSQIGRLLPKCCTTTPKYEKNSSG